MVMEILIRKCGISAVESVTPDKYSKFVKSVVEVNYPFLYCLLVNEISVILFSLTQNVSI